MHFLILKTFKVFAVFYPHTRPPVLTSAKSGPGDNGHLWVHQGHPFTYFILLIRSTNKYMKFGQLIIRIIIKITVTFQG